MENDNSDMNGATVVTEVQSLPNIHGYNIVKFNFKQFPESELRQRWHKWLCHVEMCLAASNIVDPVVKKLRC